MERINFIRRKAPNISYFQKKSMKKIGSEFDIEKYPLLKLKQKRLEYKEGIKRKLFNMISSISIRFTNKFFLAKRIKNIVYPELHNTIVNTYAEWPAEIYASILATLTTFTLITLPLIIILPQIYLLFALLTIGFGLYLNQYSKLNSSGIEGELFDIISLWYVVSSSGIPIKDQVKTIYDILRVYKQVNIKYKKLFPEYKLYNMFFEMYYDMEKRNFNEVVAFYNQLPKIQSKRARFIMSRLHRAVRDGFNISVILADEFRKIIEAEVKRIEQIGTIIEMMTEVYALILLFFIGFMSIVTFTISAMTGIYTLKAKLQPMIYQIPFLTIMSTLGMGFIVNFLKGQNMMKKDIIYPFHYKIMAVTALISYVVLYLIIGRYSPGGFILSHTIPFFIIVYPFYRILKIRRSIGSLERELSIRFQQISSAIRNGYTLSDAFDSAVTTKDPKKMDFNDVIYTYMSSYLRIGYTMKELLEKLIIRIPSEQVRKVLSIIALTEERASNLADFIARLSDAIEEKMKTVDLVESKTQLIVIQIFIVGFANVIIVGYMLIMTISPMPLLMQSLERFGLVYVPEDTNFALIDTVTNVFAPYGETSESQWGEYIDLATGFIMYLIITSALAVALFSYMYYNLTFVETVGVFLITLMLGSYIAYYLIIQYVFDYTAYHNFMIERKLIPNETVTI